MHLPTTVLRNNNADLETFHCSRFSLEAVHDKPSRFEAEWSFRSTKNKYTEIFVHVVGICWTMKQCQSRVIAKPGIIKGRHHKIPRQRTRNRNENFDENSNNN